MIDIMDNPGILLAASVNIRDALKLMDKTAEGILFVVDEDKKLLGTLTDGDIRRSLLCGKQLTDLIIGVYNQDPIRFLREGLQEQEVRKMIQEGRVKTIPIVDADGVVVAYISWNEQYESSSLPHRKKVIDVPLVVMAGGKGTRMVPFTNVLPKPLIPIGDKTILEMIVDEYRKFGVKDIYFSINYRGEMIRAYFDCIEHDYMINYLKETDFLGTAGSLKLLPKNFAKTFIVSNCDIIVRADFADVLDFHRKSGAMLTVLSSIQHHTIPYGVIKFENGGKLTSIEEKPELSFCINTGVYVLESDCLSYIPEGEAFHMTQLMQALMSDAKSVVTYPVNESEYIDIGQWDGYRNAVSKFSS